jgi:hypothetical protein
MTLRTEPTNPQGRALVWEEAYLVQQSQNLAAISQVAANHRKEIDRLLYYE